MAGCEGLVKGCNPRGSMVGREGLVTGWNPRGSVAGHVVVTSVLATKGVRGRICTPMVLLDDGEPDLPCCQYCCRPDTCRPSEEGPFAQASLATPPFLAWQR